MKKPIMILLFSKLVLKTSMDNQPPPNNADFAVRAYGSNCGEIRIDNLETLRPKSWHWIKSNIDVDVLIKRLKRIDYSMSKDTVRQDSLGRCELVYLYLKIC